MLEFFDSILTLGLYPFIFLSLYFQVFMLYAFLSEKEKEDEKESFTFFGDVTFLIPAWNESKHVAITLDSILALEYPKEKIKIICIDNNSSDDTKDVILAYTKKDARIQYVFELKQGKHHALNLGLEKVTTEFVSCLDADSTLDTKALLTAMQYFKDKKTMAVLPCMLVRDPKTPWQKMQVVEYLISIFLRKAYSTVDAVQVLPGPFSTFRKIVFDELGPYVSAHNGEDYEMTLRMHKAGYRIVNAHKAYVYTVGPSTFKSLYKQRIRWFGGFMENSWDYRDMFFKKKYGNFGLFTLPIAVIFLFYVMYAVFYTLYNMARAFTKVVENYLAAGFNFHWPRFETFYFSTDIFVILSVFFLTMLAIVLFIANDITEGQEVIVQKLPIYFILYPLLAPVFIISAFYKFVRGRETVWALQDNKV